MRHHEMLSFFASFPISYISEVKVHITWHREMLSFFTLFSISDFSDGWYLTTELTEDLIYTVWKCQRVKLYN